MVEIELLQDRKIKHEGNVVGVSALDHESTSIVAVCWKSLFEIFDSYAWTCETLDDIEAEKIYVVDNNTSNVYLFKKQQYQDGPLRKFNGKFQYVLSRDEAIETWDSLDAVLR